MARGLRALALLTVVVALLLVATPLPSAANDSAVDATTSISFQDPFAGLLGAPCTSRSECGLLPGLACRHGVCDYCRVDTDCSTAGAIRRCHYKEQEPVTAISANGEQVASTLCVEKDLFAPFLTIDVIATVLAFLSTALGSGCGIGGGGLLVPAFILVTGLSPKHAIPLSKATIFGNAIAIFLFNVNRKHPLKPHMPIINYDLAAIMEPTTLIGTVLGVMLNHILPNWLILLKLVTLLAFITYHTFLKGREIHKKETSAREALLKTALTGGKNGGGRGRAWSIYRHFDWAIAAHRWLQKTRRNRKMRAQQHDDEVDFQSLPPLGTTKPGPQTTPLLSSDRSASRPLRDVANARTTSSFGTFAVGLASDDSTQREISQTIKRREADAHPVRVILPLLVCWLVVLLQSLLRGGHGSPSLIGVACATAGYWALTALPLLVLVVIAWRVGYRLRLENRLRVLSGYRFLESDTHWTWDKVTKFPLICTTAGVAAGLLGIGGGMVQSPIMLEMGVLPAVQSATAGYMVLYTSSSTTMQFAIGGQFPGTLQYDYVAWFAFVGFLGGLAGQKGVAYIVRKYKRESIMVYILATTIGLSALAMGLVGVSNTIHDLHNGQNMGFNSLCGNA